MPFACSNVLVMFVRPIDKLVHPIPAPFKGKAFRCCEFIFKICMDLWKLSNYSFLILCYFQNLDFFVPVFNLVFDICYAD